MANPLFDAMGGSKQQMPGLQNMVQAFQQFRTAFTGDPQQQVQQLLNSGRMTQQQYNQLAQMANQLIGMLK